MEFFNIQREMSRADVPSGCGASSRCIALLLLLLAMGLSGCGDDGPPRGKVSGQVTLDGAPLPQGSILFVPIEGNKGVAAGGQIVDGKYSLTGDAGVSLGANRVEIRSLRKSGRKEQKPFAPQGEMVEVDEEAVADSFNTASTLRADVKAGSQTQDFSVTSRPRAN